MAEFSSKSAGGTTNAHASVSASSKRPATVHRTITISTESDQLKQYHKLLTEEREIIDRQLTAAAQAAASHSRTVDNARQDAKESLLFRALGPVGALAELWSNSRKGFRSAFGQGQIAAAELAAEETLSKELNERKFEIRNALKSLADAEQKFKAGDTQGGKVLLASVGKVIPREKLEAALREKKIAEERADTARGVSNSAVGGAYLGAKTARDVAPSIVNIGGAALGAPGVAMAAAAGLRSVQSLASNSVEVAQGTKDVSTAAKDFGVDTAFGAVTEFAFGKGMQHGTRLAGRLFGEASEVSVAELSKEASKKLALRFGGKRGATTAVMGSFESTGASTAFQVGQAKAEFELGAQGTGLTADEKRKKFQDYLTERGLSAEQIAKDGFVTLGISVAAGYLGGSAGVARELAEEFSKKLAIFLGKEVSGDVAVSAAGAYLRAKLHGRELTVEQFIEETANSAVATIAGEGAAHKAGVARAVREAGDGVRVDRVGTTSSGNSSLTVLDLGDRQSYPYYLSTSEHDLVFPKLNTIYSGEGKAGVLAVPVNENPVSEYDTSVRKLTEKRRAIEASRGEPFHPNAMEVRGVIINLDVVLDGDGRIPKLLAEELRGVKAQSLPIALFSDRSMAELAAVIRGSGLQPEGMFLVGDGGKSLCPDGRLIGLEYDGYADRLQSRADELRNAGEHTSLSAMNTFLRERILDRFRVRYRLEPHEVLRLGDGRSERDSGILLSLAHDVVVDWSPNGFGVESPEHAAKLLSYLNARNLPVEGSRQAKSGSPLPPEWASRGVDFTRFHTDFDDPRERALDEALHPGSTVTRTVSRGTFVERHGYDDLSFSARVLEPSEAEAIRLELIKGHERYGGSYRDLNLAGRSSIPWQSVPIQKRKALNQLLSQHYPELAASERTLERGSLQLLPPVRAWFLLDYLHSAPGKVRRADTSYLKKDPQLEHELVKKFSLAIERDEPPELFFTSFAPKFETFEVSGGYVLPDAAHYLALLNLHAIAEGASQVYSRGIRFYVGYEGGLFPDLANVPRDSEVRTFEWLKRANGEISEHFVTRGVKNPVELINAAEEFERLSVEDSAQHERLVSRAKELRADVDRSEQVRRYAWANSWADGPARTVRDFDSFESYLSDEIPIVRGLLDDSARGVPVHFPPGMSRAEGQRLLRLNLESKIWLRNFSSRVRTAIDTVDQEEAGRTTNLEDQDLVERMCHFFAKSEAKYVGGRKGHGIMNFHEKPEELINVTVDGNRPGRKPRMNFELIPGWDRRPHHVVASRVSSREKGEQWEWVPRYFGEIYRSDTRPIIPVYLDHGESPFYYSELRPADADRSEAEVDIGGGKLRRYSLLIDDRGNRYLRVTTVPSPWGPNGGYEFAQEIEAIQKQDERGELKIGRLAFAQIRGGENWESKMEYYIQLVEGIGLAQILPK